MWKNFVTRNNDVLTPAAQLEIIYDKIVHDDNNPWLCASIIREVYNHFRISEAKKIPSIDYMSKVQKEIDIGMRAMLIGWLVEVVEYYMLQPEILYLAVNYIDRYLSTNPMNTERFKLLGITCLMIASKYYDIGSLPVEGFRKMTANSYLVDELVEMEYIVLDSLKFELTVPTAKCFLGQFVYAAQTVTAEDPPMEELECMSNYLAELSLMDYDMLCYSPSLIAASSIFLARYVLLPSRIPWNSTLQQFTLYNPLSLLGCVKALHSLCCDSLNSNLLAIRVKYSHPKYYCVAKKYCPPSIPQEYF